VDLPQDLDARSISLVDSRGQALAASFVDAGPESPGIVLLHGLGGSRADMAGRSRLLREQGFSSLLVDLPGHGESVAPRITLGLHESEAARAALTWLRGTRPGLPAGAIGTSLGGAAILLGAEPARFDAVVVEAVYDTVDHAVFNRIHLRLGGAAHLLAPLLLLQIQPRLGIARQELRPVEGVRRIGAPILVVGGGVDEHTTLENTRALFAAAPEPKDLWIVVGEGHVDFLQARPAAYQRRVVGFLRRFLRGRVAR
jgi:pimeloyl-ACP methyl ester carboxylesterase